MISVLTSATFRRFLVLCIAAGIAASCAAQGADCALHWSGRFAAYSPEMTGRFRAPALFTRIDKGFTLVRAGMVPQAKVLLHSAIAEAQTRGNRCAEGLADFALDLAWVRSNHPGEDKLEQEMRAALADAGSASGVGYADMMAGETHDALAKAAGELAAVGEDGGALNAEWLSVDYAPPKDGKPVAESVYEDFLARAKAGGYLYIQGSVELAIGKRAYDSNDNPLALEHLRAAAEALHECNCALNRRAGVYYYMSAADSLEGMGWQSLEDAEMADALYRKGHYDVLRPKSLLSIATAYVRMNEFAAGIPALETARRIMRISDPSQGQRIMVDGLLAYLYAKTGREQEAMALLDGLPQANSKLNACLEWNARSSAERILKRNPEAENSAANAITACRAADYAERVRYNYFVRSQARLAEGKLEDSLADARTAYAMYDAERARHVQEDANKRGFDERGTEYRDGLMEALMRSQLYEEALNLSEQMRARPIQDLLSGPRQQAKVVHGSQAVRYEMARNGEAAGEAELALRGAGSRAGTVPGSALAKGRRGETAQSALVTQLVLKSEASAKPATAEEMAASLKRLNSTLISYWVSPEELYIWVYEPGKPVYAMTRAIRREEIAKLVAAAQPFAAGATRGGAIATRGGSTISLDGKNREAWRNLYDLLIAPVADHLPKEPGSLLTIVPHGPLFQVAFAALRDERGRYLVENYALHSIPAVGLLRYTEENDRAASTLAPHTLLVANPSRLPVVANGRPLPPLPATETEARSIAQLYPAAQVTLLDRDNASIAEVEAKVPQATVLHFATHAIVSDSDPFASFLALNRDEQGGELTTADAYNLSLHAKLVVLSACRTGLGKISGDGVDGLNRAFFYSGSASVLSTLWDVADEPTSELLVHFYRSLNAGESRSSALRDAQLAMLSDLRRGKVTVHTPQGKITLPENPAFWAAFSLAGEP